jgi:hypothetical protein
MGKNELFFFEKKRKRNKIVGIISSESNNLSQQVSSSSFTLWNVITTERLYIALLISFSLCVCPIGAASDSI